LRGLRHDLTAARCRWPMPVSSHGPPAPAPLVARRPSVAARGERAGDDRAPQRVRERAAAHRPARALPAPERFGCRADVRCDRRGGPAPRLDRLPAAQGRGVASRALALLVDDVRSHPTGLRPLVAFPGIDNPASNGVCRRNGFTLRGTITETFRGAELTINEWVLDLRSIRTIRPPPPESGYPV